MMSIRWPRLLSPTQLSQLIRTQKTPLKALEIFNEAKTRYPNYRHNGPVYATMIGILGNSGRVSEMKDLIDRMKNDSCECKDSVFAGVIKTYANAGLFNEAMSLFENRHDFNCVNFTESFNTLLEIMVENSKLETCYHFFLKNSSSWEIKSRSRSLNLLMDTLCKRNRSDLALNIFQEMGYQFCYPDRESYKILMRGLCVDNRLTEATHLLYAMFWRISQKGCGSDISIYRILLDALCDNGEVDEAGEMLEKVLKKGLKAPKKRCKQIDLSQFRHKDEMGIRYAKALINNALVRGGIPSADGYKAMAIDLYSEGRISEGDNVLEEMYKKGFKSCSSIYEVKLNALVSAGEVNKAIFVVEREMFEKNFVPSVKLHNIVIKGLCDVGESNKAMKYFQNMSKQIGCVPDRDSYNYLVAGLCCDGKYMEASQMLEKMVLKSYWPEGGIYAKLVLGLCLTGKTYKGVVWLEEMVSQDKVPEVSTWLSLVSSVCSSSQQSLSLASMLQELEGPYVTPSHCGLFVHER